MKCRDCRFMEDAGMNSLYRCANPDSSNYGEWTGPCCEDECRDGESFEDEGEYL